MEKEQRIRSAAGYGSGVFSALILAGAILFMAVTTVLDRWPQPVKAFNTVFQSILMEAFPFIFIGVLVSGLLHVFVSEELLLRYYPKNRYLGILTAAMAGLVLPVCDCAVVPIAVGLHRKGLPLHAAITFMLAAPVMDPVVIASTYYAFPGEPRIALARIGVGLAGAMGTGLLLMLLPDRETPLLTVSGPVPPACGCGHDHGADPCGSHGPAAIETRPSGILMTLPPAVSVPGPWARGLANLRAVFTHAAEEFFSVGQYLVLGAFISVAAQSLLPYGWLKLMAGSPLVSLVLMMATAFLLSICSTADAFIARSFSGTFGTLPVTGFMAAGALMDIKNLLMLSSFFNKRFILRVMATAYSIVFLLLWGIGPWILPR